MPVKTVSTKLALKGFLGYINDVRETYPPLPDAVQDLARADSEANKGKHECISACLGCSATQAEPHPHQCTVWCLECKYIRMASAITRWKAQNTRYDFTDIVVSVFIPAQQRKIEINIVEVRPVEQVQLGSVTLLTLADTRFTAIFLLLKDGWRIAVSIDRSATIMLLSTDKASRTYG